MPNSQSMPPEFSIIGEGDQNPLLALETLDERLRRYRLVQPKRQMTQSLKDYGQVSPIIVCQLEGATPNPTWRQLDESSQEALERLANSEPVGPRHSQGYQHLLDGFPVTDEAPDDETHQENSGEPECYSSDRAEALRLATA